MIILIIIFLLISWISPFYSYPEFYIFPYLFNHGLLPYKEIIDQHFPFLMFTPINFANLGFSTPYDFKLLNLLIYLFNIYFIKKISQKIFPGAGLYAVLIYVIIQLIFGFNKLWYESFLPLTLLPALYFLLKRRLFVSGSLIAFGIISKQTVIAIATISLLFFVWKKYSLTNIFKFIIGIAIPLALLFIYYFKLQVLSDFIYWTFNFNLSLYPQLASPTISKLNLLTICIFSISIIYSYLKAIKVFQNVSIILIGLWIGVSLPAVFTRFDYIHLHHLLPLAAIIIGIGLVNQTPIIKKIISIVSIVSIVSLLIVRISSPNYSTYAFFDKNTLDFSRKMELYINNNQQVFIIGAQPHLYFLSQTLPSVKPFIFYLPWYLSLAEDKIYNNLISHPPQYIIFDSSSRIDGIPITTSAPKLTNFLFRYYRPIDSIDTLCIYAKNP